MSDLTDARTLRRVATLCYVVAGTVLLFVFTDIIAVAWPFRPGAVSWRYGVIGLVSGGLYNPLLAMLLAFLGAAVAGHRPAFRVVLGGSVLGSLALLAMVAVFALDVGELRGLAQQGTEAGRFDRAGFQVFLKLLVGSAALAVMAWFSLHQLAASRGGGSRASATPSIVKAPGKR